MIHMHLFKDFVDDFHMHLHLQTTGLIQRDFWLRRLVVFGMYFQHSLLEYVFKTEHSENWLALYDLCVYEQYS